MEKLLLKSNITSSELEMLLNAREDGEVDFILIDVREPMEYNMGHIKGVDTLKPSTQLQKWGQDVIDNFGDKTVILTCRTGARSGDIQRVLKHNGHNSVINHSGGIVSFRGTKERG